VRCCYPDARSREGWREQSSPFENGAQWGKVKGRAGPRAPCGRRAALELAGAVGAEALASRALDGVEEQVWLLGERIGTRRKYEIRLLPAHVARLVVVGVQAAAVRLDFLVRAHPTGAGAAGQA
jgi:hypothetical protein